MDDHFWKIVRHIEYVQKNMVRMAEKVPIAFGELLIKNSFVHDNSKFAGIERYYLNEKTKQETLHLFQEALAHHHQHNPHHPEYWPSIHHMPNLYIAEMVCDCVARSQELCDSAETWFFTIMPKKYHFGQDDNIHKQLEYFFGLLKGTL